MYNLSMYSLVNCELAINLKELFLTQDHNELFLLSYKCVIILAFRLWSMI